MEEDWLANPKLIEPSLEENQLPLTKITSLDARILDTLRGNGVESLFPVQAAVMEELASGVEGDLLVSASTGSGKTLAYLLPVLQSLSGRLVCRLRALIVVPGRELALQVATVLEPFTEALGLSMAVVVGQTSLVAEQKKLVRDQIGGEVLAGGSSRVDILIATPGRLVDHLHFTPGFTLQHLQWLVIDEADRLLDQNFQDWLPEVLRSAQSQSIPSELGLSHDAVSFRANALPVTLAMGLDFWATPLRKLLFSATLTKNPAKLAQIHLNNPVYLAVTVDKEKYTVPADLEVLDNWASTMFISFVGKSDCCRGRIKGSHSAVSHANQFTDKNPLLHQIRGCHRKAVRPPQTLLPDDGRANPGLFW